MFERLAGKFLSRLLSKYFESTETNGTGGSSSSSSSSLGVWSGYVSLEGLELRKEVANEYFQSKGLPFELLQCTLGRVEITVPWAKLGLSSANADDEDAAVVVVVVDGVHALLKTNYDFDDDALRDAAIQQRRRELRDAEIFGKESDTFSRTSYSSGASSFFEKRLAEGIFKDILEKLHIHVRDLHVRVEDVLSDPVNPCAFGVTFESLHVQADDEDDKMTLSPDKQLARSDADGMRPAPSSGVIRKVTQLNHLAVYWNALDYEPELPPEVSILQDGDHASTLKALDRCIARRVSSSSSPLRSRPAQATPNHTFLLLPLDASWHARLSTNPRNLELRPALLTNLFIDTVSLQLRDFQCSQMAILVSEMKEHSFAKDFRRYRPSVSATEDPRAWWRYAFRIIRTELCESKMRWSWRRFQEKLGQRRRYCDLYKRHRRFEPPARSRSIRASVYSVAAQSVSPDSLSGLESSLPDEGAGPSADSSNGHTEPTRLSQDEMNELRELEDGTLGDLAVRDIVLFRALVNARVAAEQSVHGQNRTSRFRRLMSSVVSDDIESEEEYERLLAYLEQTTAERESLVSVNGASLVAVSLQLHLDRGCISLFSPLHSTEDLNQHRRIQQRFLDISTTEFRVGYSLLGNYESYRFFISLNDYAGSETRSSGRDYAIITRLHPLIDRVGDEDASKDATPQTSNREPLAEEKHLAYIDICGKPTHSPGCDISVHASLKRAEVVFSPDGQWLWKTKKFLSSIPTGKRSLSTFWEDIGMAQINSMGSGRGGLLAKAEAAVLKAKNIDVDINIHCPLLRINGIGDAALVLDLGQAHFVTRRLAGVATSKLIASTIPKSHREQNGDADSADPQTTPVRPNGSITGSTDSIMFTPVLRGYHGEVSSARRELDAFFLGGSAMSVLGNRMPSTSIAGGTPFEAVDAGVDGFQSQLNRGIYSSFYDEFHLKVDNVHVFFDQSRELGQATVLDKLSVQVTIAKSVIPSDHTLCRLRTHWMIQDTNVRLSESTISRLVGLKQSWMDVIKSEGPTTRFYAPSSSARESNFSIRTSTPRTGYERDMLESDEALSEKSSVLDETEFIDALDNNGDDNGSSAFVDDTWIADTESVADSDIRSLSQIKPRRRKTSLSEVSSISERSWGKRKPSIIDQYLSAENLARLEELGGEDDGSDIDSDDGSFHSAISLGGYEALEASMQENIASAEDEITKLKNVLARENKTADGSPFLIPEARRRLRVRRNLRMELDRAKAELSALRASHEDLKSQLDVARALQYDQRLENDVAKVEGPELHDSEGREVAARAKAVLRARRQRSSSVVSGEGFKHKLTSDLNRDLLSISLVVSNINLTIEGFEVPFSPFEHIKEQTPARFVCNMARCTLAILKRASESRLYASVEGIVASMRQQIESADSCFDEQLVVGGTGLSLLDSTFSTVRTREAYRPAMVAPQDKVLRLAFKKWSKVVPGDTTQTLTQATKMKVSLGDIVVSSHEQLVQSLANFYRKTHCAFEPKNSLDVPSCSREPPIPVIQRLCWSLNGRPLPRLAEEERAQREPIEYYDFSVLLSSLRINFREGPRSVGSLTLTEGAVRALRGLTNAVNTHRCQLEVKCGNLQVLDLKDRHSGVELLSRRDPYHPFVTLRVRMQVVPLSITGGWTVGEGSSSVVTIGDCKDLTWNVHAGAKINSALVTISPQGFKTLRSHSLRMVTAMKACRSPSQGTGAEPTVDTSMPLPTSEEMEVQERSESENKSLRIRWRGDFAMNKVAVLFPDHDFDEIEASHTVRNNAMLTLSHHSLFLACPDKPGHLIIRSDTSGISLLRTSDDWPLLEATSIASEACALQKSIVNSCCQLQLVLPDKSSWNESRPSSYGQSLTCLTSHEPDDLDERMAVCITVSPICLNVSAQAGRHLVTALSTLRQCTEKGKGAHSHNESRGDLQLGPSTRKHRSVKVISESFELKMFRESARSTSLVHADPLASFAVHGAAMSIDQRMKSDSATIEISSISVYDLSSPPGIRVFAMSSETLNAEKESVKQYGSDSEVSTQQVLVSFNRCRERISLVDFNLQLAHIQCILLPALLQSLMEFHNKMGASECPESTSTTTDDSSLEKEERSTLGFPFGVHRVEFVLKILGFECILPSRDLITHVRSQSNKPISVVTCRWAASLTGDVSCPHDPANGEVLSAGDNGLSSQGTSEKEIRSPSVLVNDVSSNGQSQATRCATARAYLHVDGFQVLRTNVKRASDCGRGESPCSFMLNQPARGEQRITNPFWFSVRYQCAAVSRSVSRHGQADIDGENIPASPQMSISQAFQAGTGFVDILLYVRQTAGGINDAFKVSIKPILDTMKQADEPGQKKNVKRKQIEPSIVTSSLKTVTTVFSLKSDGIQVTCVPGGATQLTESPIAKCELSGLRIGAVAGTVPMDLLAISGSASQVSALEKLRKAGLERFGIVSPVDSGGAASHMILAGWIRTKLSASYHNRRLVAWEPFVEPWLLTGRTSVDLTRTLSLSPSPWIDKLKLASYRNTVLTSAGEGINEMASERIRDIGRLLRSPFSLDSPIARKAPASMEGTVVVSSLDMSYVIMRSIAPDAVASALYFADTRRLSIGDQTQRKDTIWLPGIDPAKWLEQFGYPSMSFHGGKANSSSAMLFSVTDTHPLNVNLTGALIENILGFLEEGRDEMSRETAPHLIRNASGLTVRFRECLDVEQFERGERAKKIALFPGHEIPLSLKRSASQSCDPHRAHIFLELGSFEDTAGRIDHREFSIPSKHSTTFLYKAIGKISVDTVGVREYTLCHQFGRRATSETDIMADSQRLGKIIVRVILKGSTKLVSIESPVILKNSTEVDLLCELREHDGVSLLWRSLVPRATTSSTNQFDDIDESLAVALPADLVAASNDDDTILSVLPLPPDSLIKHESDVPQYSGGHFVEVTVPPPFSDKSTARGLIRTSETNLRLPESETRKGLVTGDLEVVNLNTCSIRIGSVSTGVTLSSAVPQQRMLLFRPPLVVKNYLPVSISVQARVGSYHATVLRRMSSVAVTSNGPAPESSTAWHDLGILECGKSLSWTGPTGADRVEMRVRLSGSTDEQSLKFKDWSTGMVIPPEASLRRSSGPRDSGSVNLGQLTIFDDESARLRLSVSLEFSSNIMNSDSAQIEDIRSFAQTLPFSPRVISVSVPFWIIDGTGEDLEFKSNTVIAGQSARGFGGENRSGFRPMWRASHHEAGVEHLGLAQLLEDDELNILSAKPSFEVFMLGDEKSTRLSVRRRLTRLYDDNSNILSSWCDPISLSVSDNSFNDVLVPAPTILADEDYVGASGDTLEPLALRVRIIAAPSEFGGFHGTKLIHVISLYRIVNEMGREIEVLADYGQGRPTIVGVDDRTTPFHFDGTSPIRFRPREFGWGWSGKLNIRKKRKEVALRLVHKLKCQVIIAEVEFIEGKNSGGNLLVFREAPHPPFRLENQTMQALNFGQSSVIFGAEKESGQVSLDSTILPYHRADYAWDGPDERRRRLALQIADLGSSGETAPHKTFLGRFDLDRMAPGTRLRLSGTPYSVEIVADGPTRVLRIMDSALPSLPSTEGVFRASHDVFREPGSISVTPSLLEVKLTHGIGISIVDWSPQELLYIKLDEITVERQVDSKKEKVTLGVSCISADNQLWVTPFPVLLRMGRRALPSASQSERKRKRRSNALAVSWERGLYRQGGLTFVDSFELSTLPVILSVDGNLSELTWKMFWQILRIHAGMEAATMDASSRDAELREVLRIGDDRLGSLGDVAMNPRPASLDDPGKDFDAGFVATAAVAAKLRLRKSSDQSSRARRKQSVADKHRTTQSMVSKQRSKYYVGKLKISTMQTEMSWSGPLPSAFVKLPDLMRPALTFEALPVLLRPYSTSHAYGTVEDLAHDLKSHYVSIWRVLDILFGLSFRPAFLIRACIYTSRERVANVFDVISNTLTSIEKGLTRLAQPEAASTLIANDASSSMGVLPTKLPTTRVYQTLVRSSLLATATIFGSSAQVTSFVAAKLRYSGSTTSSRSPAIRARNPRLFAHVHGKDLLVEYVEGENAGKAILSRVRMGRHLGEGYVYHCENVHLLKSFSASSSSSSSLHAAEVDSNPLIFMVTSERVFLLNGDRQVNFCSVVWESTFLNLVEIEVDEFSSSSSDSEGGTSKSLLPPSFDLVKLWYLVDTTHSKRNGTDSLVRYARAVVADDSDLGLDVLVCKTMLVPKESSKLLRRRTAVAVYKPY